MSVTYTITNGTKYSAYSKATTAADADTILTHQSDGTGEKQLPVSVLKDHINENLNKQMGTIDNASTASQAYAAGAYIMHNGVRYIAASAIKKGDTFIVGTNIVAKTVADELANLNSSLTSQKAIYSSGPNNNGVHICVAKWNSTDYGFTIQNSDGTGVQVVIKRSASSGEISLAAYAI